MNKEQKLVEECKNADTLPKITATLSRLLSEGYSIWTDGTLYNVKHLVDKTSGIKIEIFGKEHAPPHFHVSRGDIDASFTIESCQHLVGNIGNREKKLIEFWYEQSRETLIKIWNETRPTDCPVGPIRPPE
ncbi:DUF4160 domain-containing protein [Duganella sp. FT94W]|uniref:DUF4160 domain-containing protein n=1 Tax=Duganella lactea TaxID=2692173 RepID=A0ABW9VAG3_9BURK|nr:DUF4160 domain-containing protein [Duganella lactea]